MSKGRGWSVTLQDTASCGAGGGRLAISLPPFLFMSVSRLLSFAIFFISDRQRSKKKKRKTKNAAMLNPGIVYMAVSLLRPIPSMIF